MPTKKSAETFWETMQKSAEPARSSPPWMKAGINLTERNFKTFRATDVATEDRAAPRMRVPLPSLKSHKAS